MYNPLIASSASVRLVLLGSICWSAYLSPLPGDMLLSKVQKGNIDRINDLLTKNTSETSSLVMHTEVSKGEAVFSFPWCCVGYHAVQCGAVIHLSMI